MPERTIEKLMMATEPAHAAQLAMIECLRQIADGNKKLNSVLEGMQAEVRDVRERVIRIESNRIETDIEDLKERVHEAEVKIDALEADKNRREGAIGAGDWFIRSWPNLIGFVLLIAIVLVATGKVPL
jgi:chromosome segregation ATPase